MSLVADLLRSIITSKKKVNHELSWIDRSANPFHHQYFSWLPPEIQLYIFSFLPIKELGKVALVSKYWKCLSEHNQLWKRFTLEVLGDIKIIPGRPINWKEQYLKQTEDQWDVACKANTIDLSNSNKTAYLESDMEVSLLGTFKYSPKFGKKVWRIHIESLPHGLGIGLSTHKCVLSTDLSGSAPVCAIFASGRAYGRKNSTKKEQEISPSRGKIKHAIRAGDLLTISISPIEFNLLRIEFQRNNKDELISFEVRNMNHKLWRVAATLYTGTKITLLGALDHDKWKPPTS